MHGPARRPEGLRIHARAGPANDGGDRHAHARDAVPPVEHAETRSTRCSSRMASRMLAAATNLRPFPVGCIPLTNPSTATGVRLPTAEASFSCSVIGAKPWRPIHGHGTTPASLKPDTHPQEAQPGSQPKWKSWADQRVSPAQPDGLPPCRDQGRSTTGPRIQAEPRRRSKSVRHHVGQSRSCQRFPAMSALRIREATCSMTRRAPESHSLTRAAEMVANPSAPAREGH